MLGPTAGDAGLWGAGTAALAVDSVGNALVAGSFAGAIHLGTAKLTAGPQGDMLIASIDPSCNVVWSRQFTDAVTQPPSAAIDAAGGFVVAGTFFGQLDLGGMTLHGRPQGSGYGSDIFVARFAGDGSLVWATSFQATSPTDIAKVSQVAVGPMGTILLTGSFTGTITFGGALLDAMQGSPAFLLALDANGHHLWSRAFGESSAQQAIQVDAAGNVLVAADYVGTINLGSGQLDPAGVGRFLVAKLDPSGNALWGTIATASGCEMACPDLSRGPCFDAPDSIAIDSTGNVLVTGMFTDTLMVDGIDLTGPPSHAAESFLIKLDASGHAVWARATGLRNPWGPGNPAIFDGPDNVLVVGTLRGTLDLGGGALTLAKGELGAAFMAKLDADGGHVYSRSFAGHGPSPGGSAAFAVALSPSGDTVVLGALQGSLDLGGIQLTSPLGSGTVGETGFIARFPQ